jgi:hypothetical protein
MNWQFIVDEVADDPVVVFVAQQACPCLDNDLLTPERRLFLTWRALSKSVGNFCRLSFGYFLVRFGHVPQ